MRTGQTGVLGSQWQTARSPTGSHGGGWMGVGFALRARGQRMGQGMDACLPPPAATAHPAHSTHSLAPALRGPGPGSGSGRLSLATPLLQTPARATPGRSSEGEKTGLGQAHGRAAPSYKGQDRKEARDTAAPRPFPHSGRTPAPPQRAHQQSRRPAAHCSTPVRGTAACLSPRPRGGRRRTPRVLEAAEPRAGTATSTPLLPPTGAPGHAGDQQVRPRADPPEQTPRARPTEWK